MIGGVHPSASVIVCTPDRCGFLGACLTQLDDQLADAERFELIVVDNGSTDDTAQLLADWTRREPRRRRVVDEPVAGLSRARNAGVAAARGDVVLFLDDDALAPPGWVAAHLGAYERDPLLDAVGGPVVLSWPAGRPAWVTPRLAHWWSALDLGDEPQPFPPPHGPYGTNMSIRRDRLLELDGFPASLGRRGRSLLSSEEAALWGRLGAAGGRVRYEPLALVVHQVVPARATRRWVLRRGIAQGRSNARLLALAGRRASADVVASCRTDARMASADLRGLVTMFARPDVPFGDVLNDVARRSGHASAMVEHLRLWVLDAAHRGWR